MCRVANEKPLSEQTPAELIESLRDNRKESMDVFAEKLGTKRWAVIRWTKGGGISQPYRAKLSELSRSSALGYLPPEAFEVRKFTREEVEALIARLAVLVVRGEEVAIQLAAFSEQGEDGDIGEARRKAKDLPKLDDSPPPAKEKRDNH